MGPKKPGLSYSPTISNLMQSSQIPRKPKRISKGKLAANKYGSAKKKGRLSTATFQKKLVVFQYMAERPKNFTRFCIRGLLPAISVEASESEVCAEIIEVMRACSDFNDVGSGDFEFINMCGKQASVPQCKETFEWNGRAVKELAGTGCVYIRLINDIAFASDVNYDRDSSSDSDFF